MVGRSLLRERSGRRSRAIGACPSCGGLLSASSEDWFEAEHLMMEHLLACGSRETATATEQMDHRSVRQTLRVA
jgi:hypothetical protein